MKTYFSRTLENCQIKVSTINLEAYKEANIYNSFANVQEKTSTKENSFSRTLEKCQIKVSTVNLEAYRLYYYQRSKIKFDKSS